MIKYYNRKTKNYDIEQVAGDKYLTWTYSSPVGMFLLEKLIKKKGFSKLYGSYCNTKLSKSKIQKFIHGFNIDTSQFQDAKDTFKSFNDFFYRKLKEEARPIDRTASSLISPGDGRLTAFTNINLNKLVQIKGITYSLYDFIKNDTVANTYNNGTCLILRLCPTDYHRFHFLDNGFCETSKSIKGDYYSVNPIALKKVKNLFCENKREWSLFHSENFGDVLYVEVGATCVGSIIQTYSPEKKVFKGDEKGYFKFGGSTIVLFFQEEKVKIHKDILEQSKLGFESKVSMGESIGMKL
jgi:phosphatidylserine decarboxylase